MLTKYALPSTAALGFGFAIFTIANGSRPPVAAQPVAQPARTPYTRFIAGAGIVEPSSQLIAVGSPLARTVADVFVHVGDDVQRGAPLFRLDDRDLRAELAVRRAAHAGSQARLDRLLALPRAEDLPPARARIAETEAKLADARNQLALAESVSDSRAISREETTRRRCEVDAAIARRDEAKAALELLQAGAWSADVDVARTECASNESLLHSIEVELERLTVRAPEAGTVLQLNVHNGEFAPTGELATPLVMLGDLHPLHVRVDIDENDAWRFEAGASATASVRGNREIKTPLRFEYVEPYIVPKHSLTGDAAERVDTRVMQVVFSFERGLLPIRVGQQMDVFVEVVGDEQAASAAVVMR